MDYICTVYVCTLCDQVLAHNTFRRIVMSAYSVVLIWPTITVPLGEHQSDESAISAMKLQMRKISGSIVGDLICHKLEHVEKIVDYFVCTASK